MKTIISYNEHEIKSDGSLDDLGSGYNVWIDLVDPDHEELMGLANKFDLDPEALETYFNKSKKPEIRVLDNHTFTVMIDMKNKDPKTLETEGIYFFLGRHWLITLHSPEVNLKELVERLFEVKNKKIKEAQIDALYYNVLSEIVNSIDILSRQTIILRRHIWRVRNVINFLVHNEHDKEEVKYIEMVYDDISQLIDFVESYEGTINSIRELYVAKVSLQINDTMRLLTIFTVILLPLTLVTGIYGINGVDMNKLDTLSSGFLFVIIMMVAIGVGMLVFFVKKQWIFVKEKNSSERVNHSEKKENK